MDNLTRQIADFAADLSYENLPAEVVAAATRFLVDGLACGIAAYDCESGQIGLRLARGAAPERYPGRFATSTLTISIRAVIRVTVWARFSPSPSPQDPTVLGYSRQW
jgi:hypothetical protein